MYTRTSNVQKRSCKLLVCVCVCMCVHACVRACVHTLSDDEGGGVFLAILLHEVQGATLVLQACLFPRLTRGGSCCESARM